MSVFRTMYLTILQLVWTLASPKRALTGKGEVVESDDAAYDLLALAGSLTSAHCAYLPYMSIRLVHVQLTVPSDLHMFLG